jgi:hypothetical protein
MRDLMSTQSKLSPGGGDPDPQFGDSGPEQPRGWLATLARLIRRLFGGSPAWVCRDCGQSITEAGEAYLGDNGQAIWVRCKPCSTAAPTPDGYRG